MGDNGLVPFEVVGLADGKMSSDLARDLLSPSCRVPH